MTYERVRIGRNLVSIALCALVSSCATSRPVHAEETPKEISAPPAEDLAPKERYGLKSTHAKLIDNQGNGHDDLYGVRNLRTVLANTLYRGGANNYYNRYGKRDNRNPLPTMGLENLCKDGFDTAVYLYTTNYESAPKKVDCVDRKTGKPNSLVYEQISPYNEKSIREMLNIVYTKVKAPGSAPAYFHCWNGWHASGLISAYSLRQFCGLSGADAVKYWDLNTDGNNTDAAFKAIRQSIRDFVPYSDFKLTSAEQKKLCLPTER